jgi:hypothetical protein
VETSIDQDFKFRDKLHCMLVGARDLKMDTFGNARLEIDMAKFNL